MPSASSSASKPAPAKPRRSWWKRLLLGLAVLVLLLIVFHRPIIFAVIKFAAAKVGKSQGMQIDFQIHGTIFTGLRIEDLRVTPTRPGPIEKANVGLLEVGYSLPTLARGGMSSDFLRNVALHDVDVIFDPGKLPPEPPKKKEPFKLPPLPFPQRLSLRNINFQMRAAPEAIAKAQGKSAGASSNVPAPVAPVVAGATEAVSGQGLLVSGLNLELDPQQSGKLSFAEVHIPNGPDLKDVSAGTSYRDRNLQITDLALAPEIRFRTLGIDASKLTQQLLAVSLDGDFFGGQANAAVKLTGIGVPPKASVQLDAGGISLASVRDFLKLDVPVGGSLESASVRFDGASDQPKTWTGEIKARLAKPAFGETALDSVDLRMSLHDGIAKLEQADIIQGSNQIALRTTTELPTRIEDLPRTGGKGTLKITVPDFTSLPVKVPVELAGSLNANGDFTLADGKLSSNLKGHIEALRAPQQQASVAGIDFAADVSKVLPPDATTPASAPNTPAPPPKPFFDGLQTRVSAVVNQIQYAAYKIDDVKLTVRTDGAQVQIEQVEVNRGDNHIALEGSYQIPEDFAAWQKNPLALRLNIAVPNLGEFSADQAAAPLRGQMEAKGNLTLQNGVYGGAFNMNARNIQAQGAKVETADVQVSLENNRAVVHDSHVRFDEKNTIDIDAQAALQTPYPFQGNITAKLSDLSSFEPILRARGMNEKLGGTVRLAAHGNGDFDPAHPTMAGGVELTARDLQAKGAKIESVDARVVVQDNRAVIQSGQIRIDAKNGITFGGQADLRAPYAYKGQLNVDLPDLSTFESILRANGVNEKLGGSIKIAGQVAGSMSSKPGANDQTLDGNLEISAQNLQAKGGKVERIDGQVHVDKNLAFTKKFLVRLSEKNTIDLNAWAAVQAPFDYEANLNLNLLDLNAFEPILRAGQSQKPPSPPAKKALPAPPKITVKNPPGKAGKITPVATTSPPAAPDEPRLAGSFQVQWVARGNFSDKPEEFRYSGGGKVTARKVEFNAVGPLDADIAGGYSLKTIDFPTIAVTTNGLDLRATLKHEDALLRIDNLKLRQGQTDLLAGYLQVPLDLKKFSAPEGPVPDEEKIDVNIASKALDLKTLYASFVDKTQPAPASGTVQLAILAHGKLSKILAEVKVQARQLRVAKEPAISPADSDVNLTLRDDRLNLDVSVRQPQIQPLTIRGNIPLDLRTVVSNKGLDPKSPVTLTIQLPRSNLGFLARAVPAIRFIEGDMSADVRVGGTVEHPVFGGSAQLNVPAVRMQNITIPAVRDFQARLAFSEKLLRFERFNGEIGGGKFNLDGRVDFATLINPNLQLAIKAEDVLAKRDDNVTARVNADVKINGPLDAALVSGYVGITKSRYLKDIDIVPIGLPGKPAPAPPAASAASDPSIAVDIPPVNHWKFDLVIKTDDPFYVRGNLANGQAQVDLRLRGTGAEPLLDGSVQIENLTASLPFSRLEISAGNILFTSDQPLNPVIDLRGTSTIRSYLVTIYISGRAKDPKVLFTSEPPLPQEQIVSLLATGATTDELTGNTQALAGKATLLVLQDLYRRTFKKRGASRNAEPQSTLADRVNVDLGDTDPATGKQQVGATFKITDQVQFIGDLGIQGDIRGRVKYALRFR